MSIEFVGGKEFIKAIKKFEKDEKINVEKGLARMAIDTQKNSIKNIQGGSRTGKTYKRRSISHTASAPGEVPKTDRGNLVANIFFKKRGKSYVAGSSARAPHGNWLEFGTRFIEKRPWLKPVFDEIVANYRRYFK